MYREPQDPKVVQRLIGEINQAAQQLGIRHDISILREGEDGTSFPIEVTGKDWKALPMGQITPEAELLTTYLMQRGWDMEDADRSGNYLIKQGVLARLC